MMESQSTKKKGIIQISRSSAAEQGEGAIRITSKISVPFNEIRFEFARSGGPGGQNVNKVETKVDLLFNIRASGSLDEAQKQAAAQRLGSRIDRHGVVRVSAQRSRSQWRNREDVIAKFIRIMADALAVKKQRVPSRPGKASRELRIASKKKRARTKQMRGRVSLE